MLHELWRRFWVKFIILCQYIHLRIAIYTRKYAVGLRLPNLAAKDTWTAFLYDDMLSEIDMEPAKAEVGGIFEIRIRPFFGIH